MAKRESKVSSPVRVGEQVIVRTVTHYHTGRIVLLTEQEIVLDDAAWIADAGRWHNALRYGTLNEVEPFVGLVSISRSAVIDVTAWPHALPRSQK